MKEREFRARRVKSVLPASRRQGCVQIFRQDAGSTFLPSSVIPRVAGVAAFEGFAAGQNGFGHELEMFARRI